MNRLTKRELEGPTGNTEGPCASVYLSTASETCACGAGKAEAPGREQSQRRQGSRKRGRSPPSTAVRSEVTDRATGRFEAA